ncbi:MAG: arginine repressor [Gaiellaceae bacterium]
MNRSERHGAILRLVREQEIATQQELAEALRAQGFDVVQTTVSRDITELGLVKVRGDSGRLVYAAGSGPNGHRRQTHLEEALRRWALALQASGNLVVVQTPPGFANALARELDDSGHAGIAGTVAGDDTIIVVARAGTSGEDLCTDLRQHLLEGVA